MIFWGGGGGVGGGGQTIVKNCPTIYSPIYYHTFFIKLIQQFRMHLITLGGQ